MMFCSHLPDPGCTTCGEGEPACLDGCKDDGEECGEPELACGGGQACDYTSCTCVAAFSCFGEDAMCLNYVGSFYATMTETIAAECPVFSDSACPLADSVGACVQQAGTMMELQYIFYAPMTPGEAKTMCESLGAGQPVLWVTEP